MIFRQGAPNAKLSPKVLKQGMTVQCWFAKVGGKGGKGKGKDKPGPSQKQSIGGQVFQGQLQAVKIAILN